MTDLLGCYTITDTLRALDIVSKHVVSVKHDITDIRGKGGRTSLKSICKQSDSPCTQTTGG